MKKIMISILAAVLTANLVSSCEDDSYLIDTGVHNAYYDGTIYDYLNNFPDKHYFEDLMTIVKYAGLEDVLKDSTVTFFAPTDWSIRSSYNYTSTRLYQFEGQDSLRDLRQIRPEVWREYLSMYIIKDKYVMKDIPQLDTANVSAYPGQGYYSYGGLPMNVGVEYYDAAGVKYAGARQILFSYVIDPQQHKFINAYVATSDIQPKNGAIHVLRWLDHAFGFRKATFAATAINSGILPIDSIKQEEE